MSQAQATALLCKADRASCFGQCMLAFKQSLVGQSVDAYCRNNALCKQFAVQLLQRCCLGEHQPVCTLSQGASTLQSKLCQGIFQGISTCMNMSNESGGVC